MTEFKTKDKLLVEYKGEQYPSNLIPFWWSVLNTKCSCKARIDIVTSAGTCNACRIIGGMLDLLVDLGLSPRGVSSSTGHHDDANEPLEYVEAKPDSFSFDIPNDPEFQDIIREREEQPEVFKTHMHILEGKIISLLTDYQKWKRDFKIYGTKTPGTYI
jgi:hypothetical protein